eukprot:6201005-Pleurochrysis_carterae.AAC.1
MMSYNAGYKHACSPNGDPTLRVRSVTPYNKYYTQACNPKEVSTMRITKRDALPCGLQANLKPKWRSYHACYKARCSTIWVTRVLVTRMSFNNKGYKMEALPYMFLTRRVVISCEIQAASYPNEAFTKCATSNRFKMRVESMLVVCL